MPFCNHCGSAVPPNAKFCQACGGPILAPPVAPTALPSAMAPAPAYARPLAPASVIPYPTIPAPADLPFSLQEGEVLYRQITPDPKLFWRLALGMFGGMASAIFVIVIFILISIAALGATGEILAAGVLAAILGVIFVISLVAAWIAYPKFRYWVTNYRTVGRRGVVGFAIDSVPLETVSDLIIYRGVMDRILGLSSLHIQPFGGGSAGGRHGGGLSGVNTFLGLHPADVPQIQHLVLHLRDVRRREVGRLI